MNMRKTKIVCTIGPASTSESVLKDMIHAGMNVARLNFSHGTHDSHRAIIHSLRAIREELNEPVAILLDTKGPEIRIGTFPEGEVVLEEGQAFTLTGREIEGSAQGVSITYPNLASSLKIGDRVLIDDGRIVLTVTSLDEKDIHCHVLTGGVLRNRKGVNLPNISVDMPFLSERDKSDLLFGIEEQIDFVSASFVRRRDDVRILRSFLNENGGERIGIISKIENAEGVDNFEEILQESDGIMVARGDMGVEIPFQKIPGIQKKLIRRTCEEGKISITATHMLESMIEKTTPTRAEITDVANAVFDGTSAVMLSGETAMGAHPVLAVQTMAGIAMQAEADASDVDLFRETVIRGERTDMSFAISDAVCTIAQDIKARMIVAFTKNGSAATEISGFRPNVPIIAVSSDSLVPYSLALAWGVYPIAVEDCKDEERALAEAIAYAKKMGIVGRHDPIVMTADVPTHINRSTGLIHVGSV